MDASIIKRLMGKKDSENKRKKDYKLIVSKIKRAMKEQDTYTSSMDLTINLAAGVYCLWQESNESLQKDGINIKEKSREGYTRHLVNPAYMVMYNSAELTRKYLRELRLTRATIEGEAAEDEYKELTTKVESENSKGNFKMLGTEIKDE
jgi:hypothetical protein